MSMRTPTLAIVLIGLAAAPSVAAAPDPADMPTGVATCREAALGSPDPLRGPARFLEYPNALDYAVEEKNGLWTVKLAMLAQTNRPFVVSVVPPQRDEGALLYGDRRFATTVRFEPCASREVTPWPGGVRLVKRKPIRVEIRVPGRKPYTQVLFD